MRELRVGPAAAKISPSRGGWPAPAGAREPLQGGSISRPATTTTRDADNTLNLGAQNTHEQAESIGARKLVARPVVEYSPNSSPSVPGSARRARNVGGRLRRTHEQAQQQGATQNTPGSGKNISG